MSEIAIIDYGMCNLDSVARAVEKCGGTPQVTGSAGALSDAAGIILPGVGAFSDAMKELSDRCLVNAIRDRVLVEKTPFLGICLGMQLMATYGTEGGWTPGLDIIPGEVIRFETDDNNVRIPHIGWNEVSRTSDESVLFEGIDDRTDFYFVHSYHYSCGNGGELARTDYCGSFVSAIAKGNCYGVQFHPEKSLDAGMKLLRNFVGLC